MNAPLRADSVDAYATLRTEYRCCPACSGEKLAHIGTANVTGYVHWHDRLPPTLEWVRCDDCSHVFTRHFWTQAGLDEVFRKTHAGQSAGGDPDVKRQVWRPTVRNVTDVLGGYAQVMSGERTPTWLDVGCGDGALVMTASEFGYSALGLDARAEPVDALKKLGYQAFQGSFAAARSDMPLDVISMCDVLEHMPYPREALAQAHSLLRPGGLLLISLPNLESSSWRLMDQASANPYWAEIEHHHNFGRSRLSALLREHGFSVAMFDIPYRYKAQMELYARREA